MAQQKNEFAVIGLGRFGSALALSLESHGHYVLGIDDSIDIVQALSGQLTHVVALDATDEQALKSVDIGEISTAVVAIGTDFESNVLTTVALKNLGVPQVICKSNSRRQSEILLKVGADRVVLPEHESGQRLAEELLNPILIDSFHLGPTYSIAELAVPKLFLNQSLAQLNLRKGYGINVLVIKRGNQIMTTPQANFILLNGDILVVLGAEEKIEALSDMESD